MNKIVILLIASVASVAVAAPSGLLYGHHGVGLGGPVLGPSALAGPVVGSAALAGPAVGPQRISGAVDGGAVVTGSVAGPSVVSGSVVGGTAVVEPGYGFAGYGLGHGLGLGYGAGHGLGLGYGVGHGWGYGKRFQFYNSTILKNEFTKYVAISFFQVLMEPYLPVQQ